jgi:sec-independent protein translocase protein TatB
MFGMGGSEIIVILIVALLFLGPDKLPGAAKSISKGIRDIKKQSRALQNQLESDEQIGGALRDIKSALRGEDPPPRPKKPKKPKELVAGTENSILKPEDAAAAADPPAEHVAINGEKPASKELLADVVEAKPLDEAVKPAITLPQTAGEPDDVSTPASDDDAAELAAMVKPASGTVAKGS